MKREPHQLLQIGAYVWEVRQVDRGDSALFTYRGPCGLREIKSFVFVYEGLGLSQGTRITGQSQKQFLVLCQSA